MSGRAKPKVDDLSPVQLTAVVLNDTEVFPEAGTYDVPRAVEVLHERAEAGDTASKRAIVALAQADAIAPRASVDEELAGLSGQAEAGTSLTLPGIANGIHDALAAAVLEADGALGNVDHARIRDLAGAFRDVDAVLARIRAEAPRDTGPTAEAFLSAVWHEAQATLGVEISEADQLVGKLRARIAPE